MLVLTCFLIEGFFAFTGGMGRALSTNVSPGARVSGMSSAAHIPPGVIFTAPVHISREAVERAVDPANGMPALCGIAPPWNNAQPWLRRTPGTQSRAAAFLYYMIRWARHPGGTAGAEAGGLPQVSGHAIWLSGTPNSRTLKGGGTPHAVTRRAAGPGSHALPLDGYRTGAPAGSPPADADPAVNDPCRVAGAAARTCRTDRPGYRLHLSGLGAGEGAHHPPPPINTEQAGAPAWTWMIGSGRRWTMPADR